jgi:glutaredoxin
MVKEFLTQRGVRYEVRDIGRDATARDEFLSQGFRGTPVTVIDGEPIVGFDRSRILAALQRADTPARRPVRIIW